MTVEIAHGKARPSARRGRPPEMSREEVLDVIRRLSRREPGLFRVHHTHPRIYARARRMFGSWSAAVAAAGLDYRTAIAAAIRRSVRRRLKTRRSSRLKES